MLSSAARNFQVLLQLIQTPEHAQGICDVHTCMGRSEFTCKRERGARRDRISAGVVSSWRYGSERSSGGWEAAAENEPGR